MQKLGKERKLLAVFAVSVMAMLVAPVISSAMDIDVSQLKTNEIEGITEKTIEYDQGSGFHTNFLCTLSLEGTGFVDSMGPLLVWSVGGSATVTGILGSHSGEDSMGGAIYFQGFVWNEKSAVVIDGIALIAYYTIY